MTDRRHEELIDRLLDDDLDDEERDGLYGVLEADEIAVDALAARALLHVALHESAVCQTGRDLASRLEASPRGKVFPVRASTRRGLPALAWAAGAIVAVLVMVPLLLAPRATAGPARLVERALRADDPSLVRRYDVVVETREGPGGRGERRRFEDRAVLMVRGREFVQTLDVDGRKLAWGRDPIGTVWFSLGGTRVALFEAGRIPEALEEACDMRSLDLRTLLDTLPRHHRLEPMTGTKETERLRAVRSDLPAGVSAESLAIEIDRTSSIVRSVTRTRLLSRGPEVTVRFALRDDVDREGFTSDWRKHSVDGAEVLSRESPRGARAALLREFLECLRADLRS